MTSISRIRTMVEPRLASPGPAKASRADRNAVARDGVKYTTVQRSPGRVQPQEEPPPLPPKLRRFQPLLVGAGRPTDAPAPEAPRGAAVRARLVGAPFSYADLYRSQQALKRSLPQGFDRTIMIGGTRSYRVKVGVGFAITIDALHRPGTTLLLAPGGAMWLGGKRVSPSSDAPIRRMVAERINMAGRILESIRARQAAPPQAVPPQAVPRAPVK